MIDRLNGVWGGVLGGLVAPPQKNEAPAANGEKPLRCTLDRAYQMYLTVDNAAQLVPSNLLENVKHYRK